jgi:hypothetical protein
MLTHVVIVRRPCALIYKSTNRNMFTHVVTVPLFAMKPKPNSTFNKQETYEVVRSGFIGRHAHSPQIAVQASRFPPGSAHKLTM